MNTLIHRNNASKEKILASNVLMGVGNDKTDNVEKRINDLERGGGGGGSIVEVTPLLSEGVHIANIKVNGINNKIYSPEYEESVTDVLVDGVSVVNEQGEAEINLSGKQDVLTPGDNVTISDGVISATDTTYSDFVGATSSEDGSHGLVPAPTSSERNKYLRGDGTWHEVSGGGGSSTLAELEDVNLNNLSGGQVLAYDAQNQKWVNATQSGGGSVNDVMVNDVSVVTGGIANIYIPTYVMPDSTSTSSIADGGNANVATFKFHVNASTIIQFNLCFTFNIETTVNTNTDAYGDCVLTVTISIDGVTDKVLTETYGDGNKILTINYLMNNVAVGNHCLTVNFAVSGGSIS